MLTGQYYRDKQKNGLCRKSYVRNVVQCILGCERNLKSIVHIVSIKVMLAKSQTTQSITDHRDEGSYETIYNEAFKR